MTQWHNSTMQTCTQFAKLCRNRSLVVGNFSCTASWSVIPRGVSTSSHGEWRCIERSFLLLIYCLSLLLVWVVIVYLFEYSELSSKDEALLATKLGKLRMNAEMNQAHEEADLLHQENEKLLVEKAAATEELLATKMYLASLENVSLEIVQNQFQGQP